MVKFGHNATIWGKATCRLALVFVLLGLPAFAADPRTLTSAGRAIGCRGCLRVGVRRGGVVATIGAQPAGLLVAVVGA